MLGGGQALLRVHVVHEDHPLADLDAVEEDVAVGHHVLAVEPGEGGYMGMGAGGDDHDLG